MKRYYYTYFDKSYLVKGIALIESLITHERNDFEMFVICMDETAYSILTKLDFKKVTLILFNEVEKRDPSLVRAKQNRSIVEYYWSIKAIFALYLIDQNSQIDAIAYLDADLFFFSSPDAIWDGLGENSVLIHPHRFSKELIFQERYGLYNAGMMAFRNDRGGIAVLNWWRNKCLEWCRSFIEDGKFGDQLYLNDWPDRFENVAVLQNIGVGLAPWNHIQYEFGKDTYGNTCVNDVQLVFYHYHSLAYVEPDVIIPSKFLLNQLTEDILRLCFLPYFYQLDKALSLIKTVSPDFSFGLYFPNFLNANHTFCAKRTHANRIAGANPPQSRIPLDSTWDCYGSEQQLRRIPKNRADNVKIEYQENYNDEPEDAFAEEKMAQANTEIENGNQIEAIQLLLNVTQQRPDFLPAFLSLGEMLAKAGEESGALECFLNAYKLNPKNKDVVRKLANLLIQMGDDKAAERLIACHPTVSSEHGEGKKLLENVNKFKLLNLGCGLKYHPEWINVDFTSNGNDIIAHNLYKGIPFDTETFEVVYHSHVLEHFQKRFASVFIRECYRVLKPGGLIRVVVPDLEQIAKVYIELLDKSSRGDEEAAKKYEWILIEMFDQMVRNHSGGEMADYWKQQPMPAEDFVFDRCGSEVKTAVKHLRSLRDIDTVPEDIYMGAARDYDEMKIEQLATFRISGEVHQWMYDRYSLGKLLRENGFAEIKICRADESRIPNFNEYLLDIEADGSVRKPDSLFIEALKGG